MGTGASEIQTKKKYITFPNDIRIEMSVEWVNPTFFFFFLSGAQKKTKTRKILTSVISQNIFIFYQK